MCFPSSLPLYVYIIYIIHVTLCKKVMNNVIIYSDSASFTIVIIKSCHNVHSDCLYSVSYHELKTGAAAAFLINCKILYLQIALFRSASVSPSFYVLFYLPITPNCSITNLHNKKESINYHQNITKKMTLQRIARYNSFIM